MEDSVRFFVGLALLRAGSPADAEAAFDAALAVSPDTAWRRSIHHYRGEARFERGDVDGAVNDWLAADIPRALANARQARRAAS